MARQTWERWLWMACWATAACAATPEAPRAASDGPGLVAALEQDGRFVTFARLLRASGLDRELRAEGVYTVFAPVDAAFETVGPATMKEAFDVEHGGDLRRLLRHHVVASKMTEADLRKAVRLETLAGLPLTVLVQGDRMVVGNAAVDGASFEASSAVVHPVDEVLRPPAEAPDSASSQSSSRKGGPDAWWW